MPVSVQDENAVEVRKYHIAPTNMIPNSPWPLLQYKNVLPVNPGTGKCDPVEVWRAFHTNEWRVSWIFRYSNTQTSHYHSKAHECMAVLSGTAQIRFGVADTSDDMDQNTYGSHWEDGGVLVAAEAGDVFVIPAGVAHKTHNCRPEAEFKLLTPGRAQGIEADNVEEALSKIELDGYTMLGAYSGGDWDFVEAGGDYGKVWSVPKPKYDPVMGDSKVGLLSTWRGGQQEAKERIIKL